MSDWRAWPQGEVVRDGVPIHYYRTGDQTKPTVVLLHGFTDFGPCWAPVASALAPDYDLVLIDACCHGNSGCVEHGFRGRAVDDVLAVIEHLRLRQPTLMGHSMGASTAANVAAAAPEKIHALVLEDPGWSEQPRRLYDFPAQENAEPDSKASLGSPAWLAWLRQFKAMSPEERLAESARERSQWPAAEHGPWSEAKALLNTNVFNDMRTMTSTPWRETVAQITCPVLLLTSDPAKGGIVTPAVAEAATAHWNRSEVVNIPSAGHNIRREAPAEFLQAVRAFLQQVYA